MLGLLSTPFGTNTERSCVVLRRKQRDRGRSSSHKNWRSWGRRSRSWSEALHWQHADIDKHFTTMLTSVCLWTAGVPRDAETAGHSAPPGAGEREADASGAAEAHNPDESPNACIFSSLRPGAHSLLHRQKSKLNQFQRGCFAIEIKWGF